MGAEVRDWSDEEAGRRELSFELRHLARRAIARPWATLGVALAIAVAVALFAGRTPRTYSSTVTFRVTEGDIDFATAPQLNPRLRAHVQGALLSSPRLEAIRAARGLYPEARRRGEAEAIAAFRDDIEVTVWRNYFLEGREAEDDPTRTARLAIRYRGRDPQLAYQVAQDLGRAVTDGEAAMRDEAARAEVE